MAEIDSKFLSSILEVGFVPAKSGAMFHIKCLYDSLPRRQDASIEVSAKEKLATSLGIKSSDIECEPIDDEQLSLSFSCPADRVRDTLAKIHEPLLRRMESPAVLHERG